MLPNNRIPLPKNLKVCKEYIRTRSPSCLCHLAIRQFLIAAISLVIDRRELKIAQTDQKTNLFQLLNFFKSSKVQKFKSLKTLKSCIYS